MEFTKEQKLYAQIVQRAWEDAQFKEELVANPVAAIEKLTGQKLSLPEGKRLVVRDQTDEATAYINIPAKQNTEDVELNEEQLESVAGGASGFPFMPVIISLPIILQPYELPTIS
ncbi:arginyl-tRNA synthetase [Spirosoma lacussanchae]|uniref:NHLP leader peptide family RiPP precursor n=1 Tax=Spirosoma lacussanchae TaxID=1884249 RepID=UPI001109A1FC|nr:NHLP leader peptide family RiPP precursor [Spirosoma lacussanchae]